MRSHFFRKGLNLEGSRRWRSARGQNLIEAAVIVPIFLLLTFGLIDFGTVFYTYLALENGVSQATRYAVTGQQMDDPMNPGQKLPRDQSIRIAMRQATPTLSIPDSAFSFYDVTKSTAGSGGPGDVIRVSVNYSINLFTPLLRSFFANGQLSLTVSSTMKNENYS
jgi:Flp pilus assembly protein TadG